MKIYFTKMHGLGNDFVIIDAINQSFNLSRAHFQKLGNRHLGVGCDQILLVERPTIAKADFAYRIFNRNGEEVEQCGNGARCFMQFVYEKRLTNKTAIVAQTIKGLIYPVLKENGQVRVNMGVPCFSPTHIPFITSTQAVTYPLHIVDKTYIISAVSIGNPHAVQLVDNIDQIAIAALGPQIENHPQFPEKVNAGFFEKISPNYIKLRVFERGVGETLSCGTGACAAVACGIQRHILANDVMVETRGGCLSVSWSGANNDPIFMTGPAVTVFEGEICL